MKVKYFTDTDTAYLEFSTNSVAETRGVSDDVLMDLDGNGNLVGMTIEHANVMAGFDEISYSRIALKAA
jgi:uncharacterized protein YuzE